MRLTKLREISTEKKLNKNEQTNKSPRGIVRLTVEWFLSQDNNQWPGWKWILLKTDTLSMEDKTAAGAFGHARNYGPAPLRKKVTDVIIVHMIVMLKRVMKKILNGIQRYRKSCMWTVYPLYCRQTTSGRTVATSLLIPLDCCKAKCDYKRWRVSLTRPLY